MTHSTTPPPIYLLASPCIALCVERRAGRLRARRGRLLVECVIAIVLLSATSIVVLALARSTAQSVQRTQISALAWALGTSASDGAAGLSCLNDSTTGRMASPRMAVAWTDVVNAQYRQRDIRVTPTMSALAGPVVVPFTVRVARYCP